MVLNKLMLAGVITITGTGLAAAEPVTVAMEYLDALEASDRFDSSGRVTFILSKVDGDYKIRHLHWSSRRKR